MAPILFSLILVLAAGLIVFSTADRVKATRVGSTTCAQVK
jgi:hypothetical protein